MMIMKKSFRLFTYNHIIWVLVMGIFLNLIYIAYLTLYPFRTIDFSNTPFCVLNNSSCERNSSGDYTKPHRPMLRAGELLKYEVDYCRYTRADSHIVRTLIGPTLVTIANTTGNSGLGCRRTTSSTVVIPSYVPPGTYHINLHFCWQVTALHNICKTVSTENFTVAGSVDD